MTDKKGMAFAGATVKAEAVGLIEASNRTVWTALTLLPTFRSKVEQSKDASGTATP